MKRKTGFVEPIKFTGLTVFLPAVTETESFMDAFNAVRESCKPEDIAEIILILYKNASPATIEVAKEIAKIDVPFPVITYTDNGNVEQSIKALIEMAKGSHFIFQSTDREEDPKILKDFIEAAKREPSNIITGSRVLSPYGLRECALLKRILNVPFNTVLNVLYNVRMTDATLLYSIVPTSYARNLNLQISSYAILFEIKMKLIRLGVDITEIPVIYHKRKEGKSNVKLLPEGMRYLKVLLAVRAQNKKEFMK